MRPPFVLLDDARTGGAPARLYRDPVRVLTADTPAEVPALLDAVRAGTADGLSAAGFLSYEAAAAFEPRLAAGLPDPAVPLAWFGLFYGWDEVADVPAWLPDPAGARVGAARPLISREDYGARFAAVQALIAAGDLYQANLTFPATVPLLGDPLAVYAAVRGRAAAGWGAVVATGDATILSFSPELFVALDGDALTARPMKGTARRLTDPAADAAVACALAAHPKQRAENLMIVDLMRNDLSRVAVPGSVAVPTLFAVETYPTVHQMTSTVTATLAPGNDAINVLAAAFPCGSITGAPKLRAMEALAAIEDAPRGLYTGAIGRIDAGGSLDGGAQFNVAIRTLTVHVGAAEARMGLGGGIVADSDVEAEWNEALAKGAFLVAGQRAVDLIETMAFDPEIGLLRLDRHLARLRASAAALGIGFDRHGLRNELQAATFRLRQSARVRVAVATGGAVGIEVAPMPAAVAGPLEVAIVPLPVATCDWRLRHKTSDRGFYDAARAAAGAAEVVFVDPAGRLTEGSFTSLFVPRGDRLATPPLTLGLLPGVLRAELIEEGRAVEAELRAEDLAGGFFVGNALRGLMPATLRRNNAGV
ncbi:aminodeoxychorismate synthase component I [uncultured Sphingomonas sp.]|uniref:aminodeoxychorismate synthase component I n=1 Tax=uncultured Sphingomonas sp. TaxID=158754 RepID=UPI0035CB4496